MTVKELIGMLQGRDPDARVIVRGYEAGYNDITMLEDTPIRLDVNTEWYYGAHDSVGKDEPYDEIAIHLKA